MRSAFGPHRQTVGDWHSHGLLPRVSELAPEAVLGTTDPRARRPLVAPLTRPTDLRGWS